MLFSYFLIIKASLIEIRGVSFPLRVPVNVGGVSRSLPVRPRRRASAAAQRVRQGAAVSRSEAAPLPLHHGEENTTRWRFRIAALL